MTIDRAVADFYSMVDVYLESAFGKLEAAAQPEKANALGFMKSTYRQRLASSLRAAEVSLGRRLAHVESVLRGDEVEDAPESEELGPEWEDDFDPPIARGADVSPMLEHACRTELSYLHDLVRQLEQLDVEDLGTDPKLDMLMTIVGRHLAAGDQLLVFSRYTDTVDACLELFLDRHLHGGPPPHAKYTGGASWIDRGDGPLPVTKEEIRRSLDEGEITVVFCSDAASEGLNLQAARVIVNVDVPWNPARLEQRIGRIARLGQKASEVDVYNLWYPDSVEAKIYDRLLTRRDLYELAVGEFPEIVGSAIRNELAARYSTGHAAIGEDPIRVLQELRGDQQRLAIQRIWNFELSNRPESQRFREILPIYVSRTTDVSNPPPFSVSPGDRNTLSLNHPALEMLARVSRQTTSTTRPVSVVLIGSTPIGFVLDDKTDFIVIPGEELPNLLGWLALGDELKVHESWTRVPRMALADLARAITTTSMWMPKPNELSCVYTGAAPIKTPSSISDQMLRVSLWPDWMRS